MPDIEALDAGSPLPLRAIAVNASPSRVFAALRGYEFPELQGAPHEADELDQHALVIRTESGDKLAFLYSLLTRAELLSAVFWQMPRARPSRDACSGA